MEQGDRGERDLDGEAGEDEGEQRARDPRPPALRRAARTRRGRAGFRAGDDRDDRGEAQLEARPGEAVRPEQSTISAPTATIRKVSASRPSAMPARTSKAATQERTVGTSAPVSRV
jgi:hypothetical protein